MSFLNADHDFFIFLVCGYSCNCKISAYLWLDLQTCIHFTVGRYFYAEEVRRILGCDQGVAEEFIANGCQEPYPFQDPVDSYRYYLKNHVANIMENMNNSKQIGTIADTRPGKYVCSDIYIC